MSGVGDDNTNPCRDVFDSNAIGSGNSPSHGLEKNQVRRIKGRHPHHGLPSVFGLGLYGGTKVLGNC